MTNMDWLVNLEKKVQAAAKEIESLRKENESLQAKVKKLEQQPAKKSASSAVDDGAWIEEREAIRQRVEKLVKSLEELV